MKGILFKDWKIKAIAEDDREWQTRRLGGLKEINKEPDKWALLGADQSITDGSTYFVFSTDIRMAEIKPRYQVGEVVYIKEAFMIEQSEGFDEPTDRPFKNDYEWGLLIPHYKLTDPDPELYDDEDRQVKWLSPLFMPEWAARYFEKITDIRAERLQEITEEDCIAEGCGRFMEYPVGSILAGVEGFKSVYQVLWNSINAKWKRVWNRELKIYEYWQFPWCEADAVPIPKTKHPERYHCIPNPWVFVYSFKKAEIGVNAAKESMANV